MARTDADPRVSDDKRAVQAELVPKSEHAHEQDVPPSVADTISEHRDDAALATHEVAAPLGADVASEASAVKPQPSTEPSSTCDDGESLALMIASKRATIDNSLHQLMGTTPGSDVLAHVRDAVAMPSDIESRSLDVQATAVRTLLDRVEALWNDLELPALSVKRRRAVAAVVAAALDFAAAFVAHPASRSVVSASEVLSILDRIGAAWKAFRDDKQMLGRCCAVLIDAVSATPRALTPLCRVLQSPCDTERLDCVRRADARERAL